MLALLGLLAGCAAPSLHTPAPPGFTPSATYLRIQRSGDGTVALEVALRAFEPPGRPGPTVWLVGVTHLGAEPYYQELEQFLAARDLVLYEGVGATNRQFQQQRASRYSLQEDLAHALGLEFQLNRVHYDQPHFRNSDLSLSQLHAALGGTGLKPAELHHPQPPGNQETQGHDGGEMGQLVEVMEGTGLLGTLARWGVAWVRSSPRLQAVVTLTLVELLGELGDDLPRVQGLPAGFHELLRVLIEERNRAVMRDVGLALAGNPRPRSVAVFYGAGHMRDLEQRLRETLGLQPVAERWLRAFAVNPSAAGLSDFELAWLRQVVRRQLEALRPPPDPVSAE